MFQKLSFKLFLGLLFGVLLPFIALSQGATQDEGFVCAGVTQISGGNVPAGGTCINPVEGVKFYEKNNFIPHNPDITPIKTIRVSVTCIYNPAAAAFTMERGFDGSPGQKEWFEEVFRRINSLLSDNPPPSDPIVSEHITDTRIRFVMEKLEFKPAVSPNDVKASALNLISNTNYNYQSNEVLNVFANLGFNATATTATAEAFVNWNYNLSLIPCAQMYRSVYQKYLIDGACYNTPQVVDYSPNCVTQTGVVTITFAHELCHLLGLRHTYNGGSFDGAAAYCGPNLNDEKYYLDLIGTPNDNIPCPHPGGWDTNPAGPGGATNDLMGGTSSAQYLSPQQQGMMHRYLCNASMRKYVQGSPYSAVPDPTFVVSGNETWTSNIRVYNDVIVKPGATLTIQCEVHFSDAARLIVQRGGTLILDGGLLTNTSGGRWKGVEVNGGGLFTHGKAILRNDARIENAQIGVQVGFTSPGSPSLLPGGVLEASNTTFRNCLVGVSAEPLKLNATSPPASFINNCLFTWNNQILQTGVRSLTHVQAFSRRNFSINNTLFTNEMTIAIGQVIGGVTMRGVLGNTAQVPVRNCTFQKLTRGVEMLSASYSQGNAYRIEDNTMTNCQTPIQISGWYEDYFVLRNIINGASPSLLYGGIRADGVSGADIRGNTIRNVFTGVSFSDCYYTPQSSNFFGINLLNNDIRNVVIGMNSGGSIANEIGRLDCNTFQNYTLGAFLNQTYLANMEGYQQIGTLEKGVKNFFLDNATGVADISTVNESFHYYHRRPMGNNTSDPCYIDNIKPTVSGDVAVHQAQNFCLNVGASNCGPEGSPNGRLAQLVVQFLQANTPQERRRILREIVQTYRDMGEEASPFLQSITNQTIQNDMIPMLIGQGKFTQAQNAINALPFGTPEELDVRDYFQILLDLGTQGKMIKEASPAAIARVKQIAFQNVKAVRFSARAFLNMAIDTLIEETPDNNFGGRYASETGGGLI